MVALSASSLYDWQVNATCASGTSAFASAQFTTTAVSTCSTAFEPNETTATAATISSGITNSAAITTTTDIDYFKIVTTATSDNVFNLVGPSGVDYDLYIYNSSGAQIGSSLGSQRVKLRAQPHIQLMHREAEFGEAVVSRLGVEAAGKFTCIELPLHALEATRQRHPLAGIAQFAEQPAHLLRHLPRLTNRLQRRWQLDFPHCHSLEERALELATPRRTVGIHAAAQVRAQGAARLRELQRVRL